MSEYEDNENDEKLENMSKQELITHINKIKKRKYMSDADSNFGANSINKHDYKTHKDSQDDTEKKHHNLFKAKNHVPEKSRKQSLKTIKSFEKVSKRFANRILGSDAVSNEKEADVKSYKHNLFRKDPKVNTIKAIIPSSAKKNIFERKDRGFMMKHAPYRLDFNTSQKIAERPPISKMPKMNAKEEEKAINPKINDHQVSRNPTNKFQILNNKLKNREKIAHLQGPNNRKDEYRPSYDSQTGEEVTGNSSFITFGRASFVRESEEAEQAEQG